MFLIRGEDAAAAFAKSDASETFAFAVAFHDDFVAIFEETTLFA